MSRIAATIADRGKRKLLVPFFTVGYPDQGTSVELAKAAVDSGADMVEFGMPFSDPLADGPEIQYSSQVALSHGTNLAKVMDAIRSVRCSYTQPLIAMGYYNPLLCFGLRRSLKQFYNAGLDGLIVPDLPVEEATDITRDMARQDISSIFLVAPTSSGDRIQLIDKHCSDFVYAVTVTGVTGSGRQFGPETMRYLSRLKKTLEHPFVAGFGVSSPDDAKRLTEYADGVVIGSALIKIMRGARNTNDGVRAVSRLLADIRKALN